MGRGRPGQGEKEGMEPVAPAGSLHFHEISAITNFKWILLVLGLISLPHHLTMFSISEFQQLSVENQFTHFHYKHFFVSQ